MREQLKLVVTGHVDHGKSTVIGRLLYDTGSLPQGTIDKVRRISAETGQPFEFAYLLDAFEEEQKQGITIDTTQLQFHTEVRDYVIIDAPGHKEFLKNMISGASDAEAAFLVVDAERGVEEQSRRHAYMLSLLGIRQLGLIVNKMDLVGYKREVFEAIKLELLSFLGSIGLSPGVCLPVSALSGDNITKSSKSLDWYAGPTLIAALDGLKKDAPDTSGLRFPVQDVYKFDDRRIIAGRLESGSISVGDEILISPGHKRTKVSSLAYWLEKDKSQTAESGQSIGITVTDEFFNQRGEIVTRPDDPPILADAFRASLFWMGRTPLKIRHRYKLKIATQEVEAEITRIAGLVDATTLASSEGVVEVGFNEVAEVEIRTRQTVALDLFANHRATGRFVLVDGYDVAGGGIVIGADVVRDTKFGFINGIIQARCEVFEEYYYSVEDFAVNKHDPDRPLYQKGDSVPLRGRSYSYPEFFDIIVFRDQVAVKIRDGRVADILPLADYEYEGLPMVNGRGFALKVNSRDDWLRVKEDCGPFGTSHSEAAENWLDFNTYRRIPISSNDWTI